MCQVDCPTIALQTAEQNLETTVKALGRTSALILRGLDCVAGVTGEGRLGAGSWHGFCLGPHLPGCFVHRESHNELGEEEKLWDPRGQLLTAAALGSLPVAGGLVLS